MVLGCGHAGDGNVHLSVFQSDAGASRAGAAAASSPPARRWVARSPASTASAPTSAVTSSPSRTRRNSRSWGGSRRRSTPTASSIPGRMLETAPRVDAGEPLDDRRRGGASAAWSPRASTSCSPTRAHRRCTSSPPSTRCPEMRGVLALFEGVATGAADGYARMREAPAAVLLHLGPGLGNGLANLHNARRSHAPVVVIVGDHATYHQQFDAPLQSDIETVARNVSTWIRRSARAEDAGADAAAAVAAAYGPPGQIATLILPADVSWSEGGWSQRRCRADSAEPRCGPATLDEAAARTPIGRACGAAARRQRASRARDPCRMPDRAGDRRRTPRGDVPGAR